MRSALITALTLLITGSTSLSGTSARQIHPELVGISAVALNFSPQTVPGLDTNDLELKIRGRLTDAGLVLDTNAPTTIFVQITYRKLPACPGHLALRTHLALSEDAEIQRPGGPTTVYVDTYSASEEFIELSEDGASAVENSVLGMIDYLLNSREYTESVLNKAS